MQINKAKKIVIKLGSSTIVDSKGKFKKKWLLSLIQDIKKLRKNNQDVVEQRSKNTLQSVKSHKSNKIFKNIGNADITSLVNFGLLNEYALENVYIEIFRRNEVTTISGSFAYGCNGIVFTLRTSLAFRYNNNLYPFELNQIHV